MFCLFDKKKTTPPNIEVKFELSSELQSELQSQLEDRSKYEKLRPFIRAKFLENQSRQTQSAVQKYFQAKSDNFSTCDGLLKNFCPRGYTLDPNLKKQFQGLKQKIKKNENFESRLTIMAQNEENSEDKKDLGQLRIELLNKAAEKTEGQRVSPSVSLRSVK
jgi:hypothetical protein